MHKLHRMTTMTLPSVNTMYRALTERDSTYDGVFFAAIRTTGVFCRPTCVAKKPRLQNVEFYPSIGDAVSAGYRPCRRCRPMEPAGKPPEWLEQLLARVEAEPTRRW
jgi:AraC family transcriptional regulator of adaptative response/methylated-DNA-[protein]-cysteine methyltransferase